MIARVSPDPDAAKPVEPFSPTQASLKLFLSMHSVRAWPHLSRRRPRKKGTLDRNPAGEGNST
jgi:hypothetical protein